MNPGPAGGSPATLSHDGRQPCSVGRCGRSAGFLVRRIARWFRLETLTLLSGARRALQYHRRVNGFVGRQVGERRFPRIGQDPVRPGQLLANGVEVERRPPNVNGGIERALDAQSGSSIRRPWNMGGALRLRMPNNASAAAIARCSSACHLEQRAPVRVHRYAMSIDLERAPVEFEERSKAGASRSRSRRCVGLARAQTSVASGRACCTHDPVRYL